MNGLFKWPGTLGEMVTRALVFAVATFAITTTIRADEISAAGEPARLDIRHVTSVMSCLDSATGKPYFSQTRLPGITGVYASLIGVNDRIYVLGREGTGLVLEKSNEFHVLSRNELDDGFDASPVVIGNELFLRGRRNLYCIAEDE